MQARDCRMHARAGIGLSGICAQRTHCPHAATVSDANARDLQPAQATLRAAPRRRSPWPGRATSCARAACCRPGPATRWCSALRPSARPLPLCCMRRRRRRAPDGGFTTPAVYLRGTCAAVAALLRLCAIQLSGGSARLHAPPPPVLALVLALCVDLQRLFVCELALELYVISVKTEDLQRIVVILYLTSSHATDASPPCMCAPQTNISMRVYKPGRMGGTRTASELRTTKRPAEKAVATTMNQQMKSCAAACQHTLHQASWLAPRAASLPKDRGKTLLPVVHGGS